MRVLVAIDGSFHALDALYAAKTILKPTDQLFLIAVGKDFTLQLYSTPGSPHVVDLETSLDKLQEAERTNAKMILHQAARHVLEWKPTLIFATSSHVGEAICAVAKSRQIDHLFVGFNGWSFFKLALMGSVSKYCTEESSCPVSIVKNKHYPRPEQVPSLDDQAHITHADHWTESEEGPIHSFMFPSKVFEFTYYP